MALPDSIVLNQGTAIVLADSTDHTPAGLYNLGARTHQIDLTGVQTLEFRQSDKVDLGADRAPLYAIMAVIEFDTAPTAGELVNFYWAPSPSGTAGTGNPANVSGSDSAYTGYSSNAANSVKQLMLLGSLVATVQIKETPQVAFIGVRSFPMRYGSLVVENATSDDFNNDAGGADKMCVAFIPIEQDQID